MLTKMASLRFLSLAAIVLCSIQTTRTQALSIIPALDQESLPNTNFSCIGKVIGGYYADVYTGCQMFHVCTLDEKGEIHDYKFGCLRGTVFDQETRVCERADEVDCSMSESFFYLNNDLYGPGIIPPTAVHRVSDEATGGTVDFTTTTQTAFVFPETSFMCHDKVPGGLYADIETGCVVFHICSVGPDSSITDNKFVCGEGTLFDQKSRTCQVVSAVDCSISESLYYLNDRLKGPENVVDLCLIQPLGTPLADLTSGCQDYMVCESLSDGRILQKQHSCKKDYLFSQMRKRCLSAKKVNCVKETLSGILGQDSAQMIKGKRRVSRSLLLHRLRRSALPPLVNVVTNADIEDARVRRALYSLAALRRWALENAHETTFIEVYTLNTQEAAHSKKAYGGAPHLMRYGYIHRKKRDVANIALSKRSIHTNETKIVESVSEPTSVISSSDQVKEGQESQGLDIKPTSTIPVVSTITIGLKTRKPTTSILTSTTLTKTPSFSPSTLSTLTVSNTGTHTTTVTLSTATVTVTVTDTVGIQTTETPIVNTALPTLPQIAEDVSTSLPLLSSTVLPVDLLGNNNISTTTTTTPATTTTTTSSSTTTTTTTTAEPVHSSFNVPGEEVKTSTPSTQSVNSSGVTVQTPTPLNASLDIETAAASNTSALLTPQANVTEQSTKVMPLPDNTAENGKETSLNVTVTPPPSPDNVTSSTPATTTVTQEDLAVQEDTLENESTTVATNITTTTIASITEVPLQGSVNASTTVIPSDLDGSNNASMTAVIQDSTPTVGPFTRENLPKTNFTCKDKKLEQFYPDTEANCQVFHYCSPGFEDTQILDLKFLCTGATMFDVNTQKCENMSSVTCGVLHVPTPGEGNETQTETTPVVVSTLAPANVSTLAPANVSTLAPSNVSTLAPENVSTLATPLENATLPITDDIVDPTYNVSTANETLKLSNVSSTTEAPILITTTTTTTMGPVQHNWNATTESAVQQEINNQTTIKPDTIDIPAHHKQTINPIESVTVSAILLERPDKEEIDVGTSTTTLEPISFEAATEVNAVEMETVTDRFAREEIPTSTINITESYSTTEFILEDESLITTELGPVMQEHTNIFETKNENVKMKEPFENQSDPSVTDIPIHPSTTTSSVPHLNASPPLQTNSSSTPIPAINNSKLEDRFENTSITVVSENNHTKTPL